MNIIIEIPSTPSVSQPEFPVFPSAAPGAPRASQEAASQVDWTGSVSGNEVRVTLTENDEIPFSLDPNMEV